MNLIPGLYNMTLKGKGVRGKIGEIVRAVNMLNIGT